MSRSIGDQSENQEQAITTLESVLEITTFDRYPLNWARTQCNLGIVYSERATGDTVENREHAITSFEAGLQVYTQEAFPLEWARTHYHLGKLYVHNGHISSEDLASARSHFGSALQVLTIDAYPDNHRVAALFLVRAEADNGYWHAAHAAYLTAQDAEDLLFSLGVGKKNATELRR